MKAATCTEDGEKSRKCKNCDETERQTIAAGHEYKEVKAVAATCHQNGVKAHLHCEKCGDNKLKGVSYTIEELSIASSHRTLQLSEVAATCAKDGVKAHAYCYECKANFIGEEETSAEDLKIPAGHSLTHVNEAEKTCAKDGMKEHDLCLDCGKFFVGGTEKTAEELKIPASHEYGNLIAATEGKRAHYECGDCHKTFVKFSENGAYYEVTDLSPVGAEYTWVEETPATCDESGMKGHYEKEEDGKTRYFDVDLYVTSEDNLTIPAGHAYKAKCIDEEKHESVCSRCGEKAEGSVREHDYENGGSVEKDGQYYVRWVCECGYETIEPDQDRATELYAPYPFVIGTNSTKDFRIGFKGPGMTGSMSLSMILTLSENSEARGTWENILSEAENAENYPVKKTIRLTYYGCTQDVEITFEKYAYTAKTWFPVYQQGQLGALDRVGAIVESNRRNDKGENTVIFSGYLSENAKVKIVDDGGFDVNADLSAGDKQYTVKFTYGSDTETVYEVSFWYTAKRTAGKIGSSETLSTLQGEYPGVDVVYTDQYDSSYSNFVSLEKFEVIEGSFDCNVLGWQEATFALGDYVTIDLRIYVADPDEIETVYANRLESSLVVDVEYYVEKGSRFIGIDVRYYSGETGTVLLPAEIFETWDYKEPFDINKPGKYYVYFTVDGVEYYAPVYVYDGENVTATEMDITVGGSEWLYEVNGNGEYDLKYELKNMRLDAKLSDGTWEYNVPVTADMISYDKEALKQAVNEGRVFTITVKYKGLAEEVDVAAVTKHEAKGIYEVQKDGERAWDLFVKGGELYGEYELYMLGESSKFYYMPLTTGMLYTAEFNEDEELLTDTLKAFDIKTAAKGEHEDIVIYYGGAYETIDLFVFEDADAEYSLESRGSYLSSAHVGTKEEVMAAFEGMTFSYVESASFDGSYYTVSAKTIDFSELTFENEDEIDFSKPGRVIFKFSYAGETCDYYLTLVPDFDLYACEEYVYVENERDRRTLRLYENGWFVIENVYGHVNYGQYSVFDEENGVYDLDDGYRRVYVLDDGTTAKVWSGKAFGEKYSVQAEEYVLQGYKLLVYLKDGAGYADEFYSESPYISETYTVRADNGDLIIDGVRYKIVERSGVKYLELVVEGNTLYSYEIIDEDDEDGYKEKTTILFNDNNMAYMTAESCEIPEGGTEYGEWETEYSNAFTWRREENLIIVEMPWGEVTFTLNEDGTLTADEEFD